MNRTRIVLLLILLCQFVLGTLYAMRTPRWQAPDEPAHFNYVRTLAETGVFPVLNFGDYNQAYLEEIKAEKFPPELDITPIRYEAHQPPLYYVMATPIYLTARALNLDVVLALRMANVVLALVLSLIAYAVFRRVFVRASRSEQSNPYNLSAEVLALAALGIIAVLPMHLATTAAINNDTLAELLVALILLASLARLQGDLKQRRFVLIGGLLYGLALLTKTTIYSTVLLLAAAEIGTQLRPPAPSALAASSAKRAVPVRSVAVNSVKTLAPLFGISLLLSFLWFGRNAAIYGTFDLFGWVRHDAVVAGQPTTAEWIARYGLRDTVFDFFAISFKSFWGQFGWMGVLLDDRLYTFLFILTAVATLGALFWIVRLVRERRTFTFTFKWAWALLGLLALLAAAAHVYYNLKFVQPQGRYLFPGLVPLAAFWSAGMGEVLSPRWGRWVLALLYLIMLAVDYAALAWFIVPQLTR